MPIKVDLVGGSIGQPLPGLGRVDNAGVTA
jgi:hypothetical protein